MMGESTFEFFDLVSTTTDCLSSTFCTKSERERERESELRDYSWVRIRCKES